MPKPDHYDDCDDHCIVKCANCQAQGYLLRNEGETIASGDDIIICDQCQGTGTEPYPTCGHPFLLNG